jgi:nucleotide-binding universal stress UspA family protein
MIEIRRILCPIDFSDYSRRAFDHAIAVARWYDATVTVLHVFTPPPPAVYGLGPIAVEPVLLTDGDRDQLLASTRAFVEEESAGGVNFDVAIREGQPVVEILNYAKSMKADLLVLGSHGLSGFERLVLGSVTEKVLRKADSPVLIVPRQLPDAVPVQPGLFKAILCPVDFSSSSLHALNHALSLAQEADGRLAVLSVVAHEFENVGDVANSLAEERLSMGDFRERRERAIRQRLADAIPETVATYCQVETMVTHGKPWREILRVATERQIDLIVMGVQGRGAADLAFLGSTTQHVVRAATCPVLTLRRD